jgi:hypothetical protein
MPDPMDSPLALSGTLEGFLQGQNRFVVFTHSARTRMVIAGLFLSYVAFLTMFLRSMYTRVHEMQNLPTIFANLEATQQQNLITYAVMVLGIVLACVFLFYFLWALVDIWGLQVCLSPLELRIENTITGIFMARQMGVGRIAMREIESLRGSKFFTHVKGKSIELRFSPVDNVDKLIASLLSYAPEAIVEE